MSIRGVLNRSPIIVVAAVVVVCVVAIWAVFSTVRGPVIRTGAYYSADDGQTWFEAEAKEVSPIQHNGTSAVRAHLYTCPDGKKFVGYLERYDDKAKALLDEFNAAKAAIKSGAAKPKINFAPVQAAIMAGPQVKKPGDKEWTNGNGPAGGAIKKVTCPDGQAATEAK